MPTLKVATPKGEREGGRERGGVRESFYSWSLGNSLVEKIMESPQIRLSTVADLSHIHSQHTKVLLTLSSHCNCLMCNRKMHKIIKSVASPIVLSGPGNSGTVEE